MSRTQGSPPTTLCVARLATLCVARLALSTLLPVALGALSLGTLTLVSPAPFLPAPTICASTQETKTPWTRDIAYALETLEAKCGGFFAPKGIEWKEVATKFRADAASVQDASGHYALLVRLVARLEDGHAAVIPKGKGKEAHLPPEWTQERVSPGMAWCRSAKHIFVKYVFGPAEGAGVRAGSRVISVDGEPVDDWLARRLAELRDRIGFSTDQHAFSFACSVGLAAPPGTRMELLLEEPGRKKSKKTITFTGKTSARPQGAAILPAGLERDGDLLFGRTEHGLGYVRIERCKEDLPDSMDRVLAQLRDIPGLVLDFRANSGGGFDHDALLGRFIPQGREIAFGKRYVSAGPNPYGGPIVVLVDGMTLSAGETASGIFKEDGRGYMIGEGSTAGMSSSKETIELPSGLFDLYVSVGSNKGRFNEGRGIEGIGVLPNESLEYDPKDLAEGVDTLTAAAEKRLARYASLKVPYDPADYGWKRK